MAVTTLRDILRVKIKNSPVRHQAARFVLNGIDRTVGAVVGDRIAISKTFGGGKSLTYLALSELVSRQLPPDLPLSAYELSVFSQNGEDGILQELCRRLPVPHTFVEFGIQSGWEGNCVLLADVFDWSGLFIEYNRKTFEQLQRKYAYNSRVKTVCAKVSPQNIGSLFAEADVPTELGILSIDIDGNDYWVWEAITGYRPVILVIEFNSGIPSEEPLVQPFNEGDPEDGTFFGANLAALEVIGVAKDYELVHTDIAGVNAFFVRRDLLTGAVPTGASVARHGLNYYLMSSKFRHTVSDRTDWVRPGGL
jgi:hypothetical protein